MGLSNTKYQLCGTIHKFEKRLYVWLLKITKKVRVRVAVVV